MKRKLLTILLAASMILPFSACGNSASSASSDSKENTESTEATADGSNDEKSGKVPSEVTEDNIADFPVTDASEFELETGSSAYLSSQGLGGWDYSEDIQSDECAIKKYNGTDKVVVIPEEIDGKKVAYIEGQVFFNNETLEGVYVPDTVKAIGECCFFRDKNLKVLRLSKNLEKSFENSFESVNEINLPASYNYMPTADDAALAMFNGTVYLESGISDEFASWLESNNKYSNGTECFKVIRK